MRERFDAIVVGAGPAGSTCAYRLAAGGARVLLVDKARFPRDKPCGGALTIRARRQLPVTVGPVLEHVVDRMELRLRYGRSFERSVPEPLLLLTQRSRLDHHLAECAAAQGAEFRDGVQVRDLEVDPGGVRATVGGRPVAAAALIDAAGANGSATRKLGLRGNERYGVALEGNLPIHELADPHRYDGRIVVELGAVPNGYGWIFPKRDHINVGVGGWSDQGPSLRARLLELCAAHGIEAGRLEAVRGGRLPVRRPGSRVATERMAAIGDAAGLVDPLSGEGMFEAFVSSRLAADAALELLAGSAASLEPYGRALNTALAPISSASWAAKRAVDRHPSLTFALGRFPPAWGGVVRLLRGEVDHPDAEANGLARIPLRTIQALGHDEGSLPWRKRRSSEPALSPLEG